MTHNTEIEQCRRKISALAHIAMHWVHGLEVMDVNNSSGLLHDNVTMRLCSLSGLSDTTVINVTFHPGGRIGPHTHDREEMVFVLDGEYTDIVSGKVYRRGDVQKIPTGVLHGSQSDNALLTVTWRPAFPQDMVSGMPLDIPPVELI
jgi:predicted metal-dependent enzyme (double-stranded beta helix superfamily)